MENKKKEKIWGLIFLFTLLMFVFLVIFVLVRDDQKRNSENILVETYGQQKKCLDDWYQAQKSNDTISQSHLAVVYAWYQSELEAKLHKEKLLIRNEHNDYHPSLGEIQRKLDVAFQVQGKIYFEYGWEFSPGGGYFYLPKSVDFSEEDKHDLEEKLALLSNLEKFMYYEKD